MYKLLLAQNQYEAAIQVQQRLLVLHEEMGGSQSLRMAELYHFLGCTYMDMGKYGEAEKNLQRALRGRREQLGEQALMTLCTTLQLARLYTHCSDYETAEPLLRHAYEGLESARNGGPRHELTLEVAGSLAYIYEQQGKLDEAEKLIQQALNGHDNETDWETSSLFVMNFVVRLVWLYIGRGSKEKLEEAERLGEPLLKTYERRYGPLHWWTLNTVQAMAALRLKQGRLQEAEDGLVHVVKVRSQITGYDHPGALLARYNLALVYRDQKRWVEAREILGDVVRDVKRVLGTKHPYVYESLDF